MCSGELSGHRRPRRTELKPAHDSEQNLPRLNGWRKRLHFAVASTAAFVIFLRRIFVVFHLLI